MHATIRYNTLRLAMVILVGGVCYLLGARGFTVVMLALIISLPISFVLLARWRHAMIEEIASSRLKNPVRALGERLDASASAEDDATAPSSDSGPTTPGDEPSPKRDAPPAP